MYDHTAAGGRVVSGADGGTRRAAQCASIPADPVPVERNPVPQLPTTVASSDGPNVTVTDVSRIVTLDRFGTYGTTVFALGLGANLVGRDIATKFPATAHPGAHA